MTNYRCNLAYFNFYSLFLRWFLCKIKHWQSSLTSTTIYMYIYQVAIKTVVLKSNKHTTLISRAPTLEFSWVNIVEEWRDLQRPSTTHKAIPLSCWTSPFSVFSSFFNFDNSSSSFARPNFAFSISRFRKVTPSWYVAIFFFNLSLATLPASQQVFGQFTLPSYSSLPSQQSAQC